MASEHIIIHVVPKSVTVCVDRKTDGSCTVTMEGTVDELERIITIEQTKDGKYVRKCPEDDKARE
jgi:hypothetical protein